MILLRTDREGAHRAAKASIDETCITHRMIVSFTMLMLAKRRHRMNVCNEHRNSEKKHDIIFISQSRNHFLYSNFILHIEHKTI